MAFQWSEQQLKAIHTTGHPVLVSASAGAGETTVLVARLMKRMLEDQISVDRIAAMTFTEAAASEMKKRLLQKNAAMFILYGTYLSYIYFLRR